MLDKDDKTLIYKGEFKANSYCGFGIYYMHNGLMEEWNSRRIWANNL